MPFHMMCLFLLPVLPPETPFRLNQFLQNAKSKVNFEGNTYNKMYSLVPTVRHRSIETHACMQVHSRGECHLLGHLGPLKDVKALFRTFLWKCGGWQGH